MNNEFDEYRALVGGKVLLPEVLCQRINREKLEIPRERSSSAPKEQDEHEHTTIAAKLLDELIDLGFEDVVEPRIDLLSSREAFFRDVIGLIVAGYENVEDAVLKHYEATSIVEALESMSFDMEINDHRMAKDALSRFNAAAEVEALRNTGRALRIFNFEKLSGKTTTDRVQSLGSDTKKMTTHAHANAVRYQGYRLLPDLTEPLKELERTGAQFGNFKAVIDNLVDSLTLCQHQKPEGFHVRPILMNGAPGVGKTAFGNYVGRLLGVPFEKVSAAGLQNGFVLCGSAKQWSGTTPGLVFNMLSESDCATGILLIDEVDKLPKDERYNTLAALLDLLEPESARQYKDESADIVFDASRLIILMTSNSIESIDEALLSRCTVAEISEPQYEQRLAIMQSVFSELNAGLQSDQKLNLDLEAAMVMASRNLGLRDLIAAVKTAFVAALRAGSDIVRPMPDGFSRKEKVMGFMLH